MSDEVYRRKSLLPSRFSLLQLFMGYQAGIRQTESQLFQLWVRSPISIRSALFYLTRRIPHPVSSNYKHLQMRIVVFFWGGGREKKMDYGPLFSGRHQLGSLYKNTTSHDASSLPPLPLTSD